MRVVVAHSRYLSGDASGENRVVDDEVALLRDAGHDVDAWQPSPEDAGGLSLLRTGVEAIWSKPAADEIRRRIRALRADVVHVHNLYPALSPSVLRAAAGEGVGLVMTLHNYRMLCLPSTFLRDGRICEDCFGHAPWRGVVHRCYRGSLPASGALATSITLHRVMASLDRVTLFLAVGDFVKEKHVAAGWDPGRIAVRSNFAWPSPLRDGPGGAFLYVGRLSPEKGLGPLLASWPAGLPLRVVGDGPERAALEGTAPPSVEFVGAVPAEQVGGYLRQARALILPSICYEGQPRSILEAFAAGVPVVASALGGMVDLVDEGASGFLPAPGDRAAWRSALDELSDDDRSVQMGVSAHDRWRARYSPERGLTDLESAYDRAVAVARRAASR